MTRSSNEPREALTPGVREDQAAGGRSAATVAQPTADPREAVSTQPVVLVTRGRLEYLTQCPHCAEMHRHTVLGSVTAPCGAQYELEPRRAGREP